MNRNLYAIIISYNKIEPVFKAVDSVFKGHKDIKVILIDNSKISDVSKKLKEKLRDYREDVFFIKNKTNLGFSKAVNQGIKIALDNEVDYILLLNDDAYLDRNCIDYLIEALDGDKKAMLAGPTIFYHTDKNKIWHTGGYYNKLLCNINIPFKNKKLSIDYLTNLGVQEVDFLTGCVLMLKSDVIEKVGLFDENLFFYSEDLDYCLRVKKKGFKLLWVPYAFAWHDIDIEKGRTNPFVMYNLAKSNIIVRRKNFSKFYYFYYLFLHIFLYTPFRLYQILKGSKNFEAFISWLRGAWDGISFKK